MIVIKPENRNHIGSLKGMVEYYQNLVKDGTILVGSAGYNRMIQLRNRLDKRNRLKKYGLAAEQRTI